MTITVDGEDYYVLVNAARAIKGVEGLSLEIGLRAGGGSCFIMETFLRNADFGRTHIAVDPYGNIPYPLTEKQTKPFDYTTYMMKQAMIDVYSKFQGMDINFLFFPLEDTEFFQAFSLGVPVYYASEKKKINEYALVHFDGPHTTDAVMGATHFFEPRAVSGAQFVYDDINYYYDHQVIHRYLENSGWEPVEETIYKASYRKN